MGEVIAFARARNSESEAATTRVYIICSESGHTKVGISDAPLRRLAALQTANPFRLSMGHYSNAWPRRDALSIEQEIHAYLERRFSRLGEWFHCAREDALRGMIEVARARLGYGRSSTVDVGDVI